MSGAAGPQRIRVSDRVCRTVPTSPGACAGAQIPRAVQRQVIVLLGGRVRFAATPASPRPSAAAPVVQFGRLVVHGKHAELGIEIRCGRHCGVAETLRLRKTAGHWQVSGPPS